MGLSIVMKELENEVVFLPQHLTKKFQSDPNLIRTINESGMTHSLHLTEVMRWRVK